MPVYNVPIANYRSKEDDAVAAFERLGWSVRKANGDSLISENGNFHSVTRNVPRLNDCQWAQGCGKESCRDGPGLARYCCLDASVAHVANGTMPSASCLVENPQVLLEIAGRSHRGRLQTFLSPTS